MFRPKELVVKPIPAKAARQICEARHYLHSGAAGVVISLGIFVGHLLLGVAVLGVGPTNVHRLFKDAKNHEVTCLARLWLDDRLGRNSESRTLGIILRMLRREQSTIKAVVAYSDPLANHSGVIYRASDSFTWARVSACPFTNYPMEVCTTAAASLTAMAPTPVDTSPHTAWT
jgi:hypothetical protein